MGLGEDVEGVGTLTGWTSLREGAGWCHWSAPRDGEVRQEHEGKQRLSSRGVSGKNSSSCSISGFRGSRSEAGKPPTGSLRFAAPAKQGKPRERGT